MTIVNAEGYPVIIVYTCDYNDRDPDLFALMEEIDHGQYTLDSPSAHRMIEQAQADGRTRPFRIFAISIKEIKN